MIYMAAYAIPTEQRASFGQGGCIPITQATEPTEAEIRACFSAVGFDLPAGTAFAVAGPFVTLLDSVLGSRGLLPDLVASVSHRADRGAQA